jgi:hypothetical protein
MSLFDSASLVVTPNGVKEGKLYSIKPTDGSGNLSVTRATTATRVNSAGLVEVVPYNLATYSEQFDNAAWTKIGSTITANSVVAPNGTTTADKFESSSAGTPEILQTTSNSNVKTISFYAKAGNVNFISLWIGSEVKFNLSTGTVVSGTGTIESVGNGWYRCVVSNTTFPHFNVFFSATASGQFVYLWGAQLNDGTIKDYQKTETRLNIPRLDYTNGSCPSILVEPQRTNYQLYSQDSSNWFSPADGLTVSYNTNETLDPSGLNGAEKVTSVSGNKRMFDLISNPIGALTISAFVKAGTGDVFSLRTTSASILVEFNLTTQSITSTFGTGTIKNYGNGWYRVTASTSSSIGNEVVQYSFLNDSGEYMYFWGAQVEAGTYATSYIPTVAASVTRNADVISKTGISSLIGQTEGSAFVDINLNLSFTEEDMRFITISDESSSNWYFIGTNTTNEIRFYFRAGATTYVSELVTLTSGRHKLAFAYKNNDYVAYVDGVQIYSTASLSVGSTSSFDLGKSFGSSGVSKQFINSAILWKERLTNEQLAQLTTI